MKGIRSYSHADRERVIEELIPLIRKKFGENLVALAASASFARGEDSDYSDLELTAFVEELPAGARRGGMGRIRDGMLIVLSFLNQTPYATFARFIAQARAFALKPAGFEALLDIVVHGSYQDLAALRTVVVDVFSQFEAIFEALGVELYDRSIDPDAV